MPQLQSLFYSTDTDKQTLHRRITPNAEQSEDQQERWNDLRDFLIEKLREKTGYPVSSWLQGSYKFGTQTRPARRNLEFDIDLGIYFEWSGEPSSGKYSPQQLRNFVQECLFEYTQNVVKEASVSAPKERCLRIKFPGDFHIDIPCYHLDSARDERMLATESKGWQQSDPKAFYRWFRDTFTEEENTQIRRLTRYFKIWSLLNMKEAPSSILITVLVADAYRDLSEAETETDDLALYYVARAIYDRLQYNREVKNPADEEEDLNRLSEEELDTFFKKLRVFTALAKKALEEEKEIEATSLWSKAFHHFFQPPRDNPSDSTSLMVQAYTPEVDVEVLPEEGTRKVVASGHNGIKGVPINCDIYFNITNHSQFPPNVVISWMVRNEGGDAEFNNDMGHPAGEGWTGKERSQYIGTHYMDVEVRSSAGDIIGFRHIPVEIRGIMPVRNPKKPSWTSIYRKRR
jgi:hypothetical protein